jgi:hypothetical protein
MKGGMSDDLGSGDRPLAAAAVPSDLNNFFLRHSKPFLPAVSKVREIRSRFSGVNLYCKGI